MKKKYSVCIQTYQGATTPSIAIEAAAPHTAVHTAMNLFKIGKTGAGWGHADTRCGDFAKALKRGSMTIIVSECFQ